jgi:response regulator RpfG family c-di-GMP phosphodiesterase
MTEKTRILFVDDEKNILSAIKRALFDVEDFLAGFATSGREGLELLSKEDFHVVVSDQNMPEMLGCDFLHQVSEKYPRTIRILLTGYSDIELAIAAVNKGNIFAYLRKPIANMDLIAQLKKAADYYWLQEQNRRLLIEVNEKNVLLEDLNQNLEKRIKERTLLLVEKNQQLIQASKKLKNSLDDLIKISLSFLEISIPSVAQHSIRVAEFCKILGKKLDLSAEDAKILENSALLHDIGKIGLPDEIAGKAFFRINTPKEKDLIKLHPEYAVSILSRVDELRPVLPPILFHHEYYDGSGFPEGLKGDKIPYLARILAIANMYDIYKQEKYKASMSQDTFIKDFLKKSSGNLFDPVLIEIIFGSEPDLFKEKEAKSRTLEVNLYGLREGMKLAENIVTGNKLLILPKGDILDSVKIRRILNFKNAYGIKGDKVTVFTEDE